jgi:hypothetical protein
MMVRSRAAPESRPLLPDPHTGSSPGEHYRNVMLAARTRILTAFVATSLLSVASLSRSAAAQTVVQVPVDGLIDGRTVSTVANGAVVPWTVGQGVDGDGNADGFVTTAAEAIIQAHGTIGKALPDDGVFPADAASGRPEIALHFSNAAPTTSPQTHQVHQSMGAQSFQITVPQATYAKMYLLITTSEGGAKLTVTLNYAGGKAPVVSMLTLPDYGIGGAAAGDPVFFNLIAGMRKWSSTDAEGDSQTHGITGITLTPSATDMLTSITVAKTNGSHVVFWGATGVATSAVSTGSGGSGGASAAGASGISAGGASAASGAGGVSASSGAAGVSAAGAGGVSASSSTAGSSGAPNDGSAGSLVTSGGASAAGSAGAVAGSASITEPAADNSSGCSVTAAPARNGAAWGALLLGCGLLVRRRRRQA